MGSIEIHFIEIDINENADPKAYIKCGCTYWWPSSTPGRNQLAHWGVQKQTSFCVACPDSDPCGSGGGVDHHPGEDSWLGADPQHISMDTSRSASTLSGRRLKD